MSILQETAELGWEWPAGRPLSHKMVVEVANVGKNSKLLSSPSFARDLPDPVTLSATVLLAVPAVPAKSVSLVLPSIELGDAGRGDRLAFGLVGATTVVCVNPVPADVVQARLGEWLEEMKCEE